MPLVPGRRRVLSASAQLLSAVLVMLATLFTPSFAAASIESGNSFTLVAQSNDVVGSGKFSFAVEVRAAQFSRDLAVEATLFPKLENRSEFSASLSNVEPQGSSCLDKTGPLALARNPGPANGITHFKLSVEAVENYTPCATTSNDLVLGCSTGSCGGVYPIQISLVEKTSGTVIGTFTTHLVELDSGTPAFPLNVGLVLSLGSAIAIGPGGRSTLTKADQAALSATLTTISAYPHLHLTLAIYPQLLIALADTTPKPTRLISRLHRLIVSRSQTATIELLHTPFLPLDASALAAEGATTTFDQLLERGTDTTSGEFGSAVLGGPYLAPAPLTSAGGALLAATCISQVILQPGSAPPPSNGFTETAPLSLTQDVKGCGSPGAQSAPTPIEAFVADPAGSFLSTPAGDPVLAAHRLLASLAQIYFEEPNASPRSVALTENGAVNAELLNVVLNGLNSNAYVKSATATQLFATSLVASSGDAPALSLASDVTSANVLSKASLENGANEVGVVASVVPSDTALLSTLADDVTFATSYGLSANAVARYLDAASTQLRAISKSLSFLGSKQFTLTAATGKIPITIQQAANLGPINVVIRLQSSTLVVLSGARNKLSLQSDATTLQNVQVNTEGPGESILEVDVVTPRGNDVLLIGKFDVQSTAISGVAVAISILSLVILAAWWLRSVRRKRRSSAAAVANE